MGYRLENKPVDLSGLKELTFVPSQKAGDVYRFRNYALRIFQNGEKVIDEDTARYLTTITTDRIILPRKLLFYKNNFAGYTMKLVSQKGSGKKIITTPKDEFIDSIEVLEDDIKELSQKKVLLNDITPQYTLYNGELYLVNPSKYSLFEANTDSIESINRFQLHQLITELISMELKKDNFTQPFIKHLKELMSLKDEDQKTSDFLYDLMADQKNIKQFIKKIG